MSSEFQFNTSNNKNSGYTPIKDNTTFKPAKNKPGATNLPTAGKVNPVTADYSGGDTKLLQVTTNPEYENTGADYIEDYTVLYGDEIEFQDMNNIRNDMILYFIMFSNLDKDEAKQTVTSMSDKECLDFYNKIYKEIAVVDYFVSEENLSRAEAFNELNVYIQEFKGIDGAYEYVLKKQKRPAISKMLVELGVCEDVANEYVKDIPDDELDDEYTRIVSIVEDKNNYYEKNGFLSESFAGTDLEGSFAIIKVSPALATKNISYKDNYSRMIDYIMVTKNISEEEATVIVNDYSYGNIMNYGNKYNVLLDYYVKKGMPLEEAKKHVYYLDYNTLFDEYDYVETANKLIDYYIGLGCDRSIAENYVYNLSLEDIEDTLLWDTDEKSLKDANYKLYLLSDEEAYNVIYEVVKSGFEIKAGLSGGDMSTFESMTKEEIIDYYIEVKQKSLKGSSNKESLGDKIIGFFEDKTEIVCDSVYNWTMEVKDVGYNLIFGDEETRKATVADILHNFGFAAFDGLEGTVDTFLMWMDNIGGPAFYDENGEPVYLNEGIINTDISGLCEVISLNQTVNVGDETMTLKEYFERYSVVDPEGYLAMSIESFGRQMPSLILTICTGGQSKALSAAITFFSTYATTNGCTYEELLSEKQVAIDTWESFIEEFEKLSPEEKLELLQDEENMKLIFTMYEKAMQAYATDNNDLKIKSGTTAFKEGLIECAFGGVMGSEAETFVSAILGEMLEETISFGADPTVNYWSDVVINLSNYDLNSMEGWIGLLQGWGLTYTDFFTDEETFQEFLDTMIVTATTVGISRTTTNIPSSTIDALSNKLNITDRSKLNKILELTDYISKDIYITEGIDSDVKFEGDPPMQAPIIYDFEVTPSEISSLVDDVNSNGSLDNNSKNKLVECLTTKSSPGDQFNAFVCLEKYDPDLASEIFAGFDSHQKLYFIKGFSTYDNNIFDKYCNEATFNSLDTIDQSELIGFLSDINPKVASKFYSLANSEIQKNLDDSLSLEITSGIFDDDYVETIDISEDTVVRTSTGAFKYSDYINLVCNDVITSNNLTEQNKVILNEALNNLDYNNSFYNAFKCIDKYDSSVTIDLFNNLSSDDQLSVILLCSENGDFQLASKYYHMATSSVQFEAQGYVSKEVLETGHLSGDSMVDNNSDSVTKTFNDKIDTSLYFGDPNLYLAGIVENSTLSHSDKRRLKNALSRGSLDAVNEVVGMLTPEQMEIYNNILNNPISITQAWHNSLSDVESAAIVDYSKNMGSIVISDLLMEGITLEQLENAGIDVTKSYVSLNELIRAGIDAGNSSLDSAIEKFGVLPEPLTVYRGVSIDTLTNLFGDIDVNNLASLIGQVYTDSGYTSTSLIEDLAKPVEGMRRDAVLHINVPNDANYGAFIETEAEMGYSQMEFLLKRGITAEVTNAYVNEDGVIVVEMDLVNNTNEDVNVNNNGIEVLEKEEIDYLDDNYKVNGITDTKAREMIDNFAMAFYDSDPACIEAIKQGAYEQYRAGNTELLRLITRLSYIVKSDPANRFRIITHNNDRAYWSNSKKELCLSNSVVIHGAMGTFAHEAGHALWYYTRHEIVPNNYEALMGAVRIRLSSKESVVIQNYLAQCKQVLKFAEDEARKIYKDSIIKRYGSIENYIDSLAEEIKQGALFSRDYNDYLKNKVGLTQKQIDGLQGVDKYDAEAIAWLKYHNELEEYQDHYQRENYLGIAATSDIIDAMFYGQGFDLNGNPLHTNYAHGKEYYNDAKVSIVQIYAFHEMIADYSSLKVLNNTEALENLERILGSDAFALLDDTYEQFYKYY